MIKLEFLNQKEQAAVNRRIQFWLEKQKETAQDRFDTQTVSILDCLIAEVKT